MSLYDVTDSAPVITVPKYRRNGARYGLTACVGGCVDQWSSSHLCDNKKFWSVVKSLLSNKVVYNDTITLVEDDKIIENDKNTASILSKFFCLNKYQNILNLSYQNFNVVLENGIVVSTVY